MAAQTTNKAAVSGRRNYSQNLAKTDGRTDSLTDRQSQINSDSQCGISKRGRPVEAHLILKGRNVPSEDSVNILV
jgi:hypothetical protein